MGWVPFYDWTLKSGSLPAGLTLDRFTGTISGTVSASQPQNNYSFTIELRDYDELAKPFTRSFQLVCEQAVNPCRGISFV